MHSNKAAVNMLTVGGESIKDTSEVSDEVDRSTILKIKA
jgi:hypothetical protein